MALTGNFQAIPLNFKRHQVKFEVFLHNKSLYALKAQQKNCAKCGHGVANFAWFKGFF
jgi:hypothetical protein